MSRIGNRIIAIPENVTVTVEENNVLVKGPKGELSTKINKNINVEVKDNTVVVERNNDMYKNFHGTANANIKNMIIGVTEGYEKNLEAVGVGYRFTVSGNKITVNAGYSHPVIVEVPLMFIVAYFVVPLSLFPPYTFVTAELSMFTVAFVVSPPSPVPPWFPP